MNIQSVIKKVAFILVFLLGIGAISVYVLKKNNIQSLPETITAIQKPLQQIEQTVEQSAIPMPFAELTIPYLRSRTYNSQLAELQTYQNNTSYTSYLTSYQSDGLKINGLLTQPKGEMPEGGWPAIVFVHGYIPPTLYRTTERYADHINYLARNGFVVFKIDLRGHDDSEGTPGGSYFSGDYIIDTLHAYSALQNSGFVNPSKIGLWGHSMAGNVTMRSLAAKPDIPAIVIWGGAVYSYEDRLKYGIDDNSYRPPVTTTPQQNRRRELIEKYGDFTGESFFWKLVAPTNYLGDIKGAIQLNHAVDDTVVNVGYSRDLDALLDNTSIPHELHEYRTGGHNITGSSFSAAMKNTVDFYKKYLNADVSAQ